MIPFLDKPLTFPDLIKYSWEISAKETDMVLIIKGEVSTANTIAGNIVYAKF